VNVDGYFMEWDTDRAGGFEPPRFLPKDKKSVVLGLVTSKSGLLESKDDLKRRIEEASKYADLDQIVPEPAMRVRMHRRGKHLDEKRAVGQAVHPCGGRRRGMGLNDGFRRRSFTTDR
jgi:5-methyltetrahydropteroyltriglutamate--homocysteine methyltransferase